MKKTVTMELWIEDDSEIIKHYESIGYCRVVENGLPKYNDSGSRRLTLVTLDVEQEG